MGEPRLYLITRDVFEGEGIYKIQTERTFVGLRISDDKERLQSTYNDCDVIEVNTLEDYDISLIKKEV